MDLTPFDAAEPDVGAAPLDFRSDDVHQHQTEGGPWVEEFERIRTRSAETSPILGAGMELRMSSPPAFAFDAHPDDLPRRFSEPIRSVAASSHSSECGLPSWAELPIAAFKFRPVASVVAPNASNSRYGLIPAQSFFDVEPSQDSIYCPDGHSDHHRAFSAPDLRHPTMTSDREEPRDDARATFQAGLVRRGSLMGLSRDPMEQPGIPWTYALYEEHRTSLEEADPQYSPRSPGLFPLHQLGTRTKSSVGKSQAVWHAPRGRSENDSLAFAPVHHPIMFDQSPHDAAESPLPLTFSPSEHSPPVESRERRLSSASSNPHDFSMAAPSGAESQRSASPAPTSPPAADSPCHSPTPSLVSDAPFPAIVHLAAANRVALAAAAAATAKKPRRRPSAIAGEDADVKLDKRHGLKATIDVQCVCSSCGDSIGKLVLRGKRDDLDVDFEATFTCPVCFPLGVMEADDVVEEDGTYEDSLSAAVDRLQGIAVAGRDPRGPPPKVRTAAGNGKKRKASAEILTCDVCIRDIGTGAVVLKGSREEPSFGVEAICAQCCDRYRRCSDCGGGGGPRLGVGKWRAKELFPQARKTCTLSHLRLGSLDDMYYDVWPVRDLPEPELDGLVDVCRDLYTHHMLAGLAVPEILEPVQALARTHDEVKKLAADTWAAIEPMLREDVQGSQSTRRYVALRWSTPTPRKKHKMSGAQVKGENASDEDDAGPLVREGKNLSGFVIAELDLLTGGLFLAVTTPWATGGTYDATTLLMQNLLRRIEADISGINVRRKARKAPLYPDLGNAWLMMFFKKESRLMSHLEHRRGFDYLETYLERFPTADRRHFAPHREVFLPPQYQKGWHVLVRSVVKGDDWNARPSVEDKQRKKQTLSTSKGKGTRSRAARVR